MTGVQWFFAILFGMGMGIGAAFWIGASLLEKKNSVGNDRGEARLYSTDVTITGREKLENGNSETMMEYLGRTEPEEAKYPKAPMTKDLVTKERRTN